MHRQEPRQPLTHSLTLTHGQTDFYSFTCLPTRLSSPLLYLPPQWPSPVTQTSYLQPLRPICLHSAPTVNQQQAASTLWQSIIGQKHQTTTSGINTDINNQVIQHMMAGCYFWQTCSKLRNWSVVYTHFILQKPTMFPLSFDFSF